MTVPTASAETGRLPGPVGESPAAPSMIRLRLGIAFDGTAYQGWQAQKTGTGIQSVVEAALHKLFAGAGPLHGSSRTDTGVHALGMVAHVDIPKVQWRMTPRRLILALNAHLPEDVRLLSAARARRDFHARFDAVGKEYRYFIWNAVAMNPLLRGRAWHVPRHLDLTAMRTAAAQFVGRHDFTSFTANPGYPRATTVRTITRCHVRRRGPEIVVIIEGEGFLYKMCRGMAGTLLQIGAGRFPPSAVTEMLARRDRGAAGMTAPAEGLVLWKVRYPKRGEKKPERNLPADDAAAGE